MLQAQNSSQDAGLGAGGVHGRSGYMAHLHAGVHMLRAKTGYQHQHQVGENAMYLAATAYRGHNQRPMRVMPKQKQRHLAKHAVLVAP